MKIRTYYSEHYLSDVFSMKKLGLIAKGLEDKGLAELVEPNLIPIARKLKKLHSPIYVAEVLNGVGVSALSNEFVWSPELRDGVLWSNAGVLEAAGWLMEEPAHRRVVSSISQGFHHAGWSNGGGYCTFNGLALIASEMPSKTIFVLDCDEHQGNGTKDFTRRLSNLYNYSIFGTHFGDYEPAERSWDNHVSGWEQYESALWESFITIERLQPDLIVYQAGVDCHKDDGMGMAGLNTAQLKLRDKLVFEFSRDVGIPILFVVAGGYGSDAVKHHIQTWESAVEVFEY